MSNLTPQEKKFVEKLRKNPNIEWKPGLTDEEILAQARFVETGEGVEVFDSLEEYKAEMKRRKAVREAKKSLGSDTFDEIEEV